MQTLDQGEGGGNPFASALIELLNRPSVTYAELCADLITLTKEKSGGIQVPDVSPVGANHWCLKPVSRHSLRVALVFVFTGYLKEDALSLPGAARDLKRITKALKVAGFDVQSLADPSKRDLQAALNSLSNKSEHAEAAVIYTTGHGLHYRSRDYLLPSDYPFELGKEHLAELAINVQGLQQALKAKLANLVFYGGCRTSV